VAFSIELTEIKNLTSDIDILASQEASKLDVAEYGEKSIAIHLSNMRVSTYSLLSISGKICFKNQEFNFSATGQVAACETHPSGKLTRLEVQLRQIDNEIWDQFLQAGKEEQARIDHLFYSIKGVR